MWIDICTSFAYSIGFAVRFGFNLIELKEKRTKEGTQLDIIIGCWDKLAKPN